MEKTCSFTNLNMWKLAHELVLQTYKVTSAYPKSELFCLTNQFRRAVVSIPANIAEGYKRLSKNEKLRFFNIAQASLEECRYYIILSKDLLYINDKIFETQMDQLLKTSKSLNKYCEKLLSDIYT